METIALKNWPPRPQDNRPVADQKAIDLYALDVIQSVLSTAIERGVLCEKKEGEWVVRFGDDCEGDSAEIPVGCNQENYHN